MSTKVLWIMLDDAGRDFACYGHPYIISPNVDLLAENGIMFENFRVMAPVCTPSRASYITGQSPENWWIQYADNLTIGRRQWLSPGATTIQRAIKTISPSPKTCHVGKWHLGIPGEGRLAVFPTKFGIDRFYGNIHGYPNNAWLEFARYNNTWLLDQGPPHIQTTGFITDVEASFISDWLDGYGNSPEGWLLSWWCNVPHTPLDATVPQTSLYPAPTFDQDHRTYYGSMSHFDDAVGTIITKLQNLGIYDDTHIIISSDNGPTDQADSSEQVGWTGGRRGYKHTVYEGGINVPLIWKGPGIPSGAVDTEHRLAIDFFPTVASLYGFDSSAWPGSDMFSSAPVRDMGFRMLGSSGPDWCFIRVIGDGRTVKVLRYGSASNDESDDRFYCIDTISGEDEVNRLTVVASGAVAGQINQSDATSLTNDFTDWIQSLPSLDMQNFTDYFPVDEEAARLKIEEEMAAEPDSMTYRFYICGTVGSTLQNALNSLTNFPLTKSCSHGQSDLIESSLGTLPTGNHPIFGSGIVVSTYLHQMCLDPSKRANCTSEELEEIDARLSTTSTKHMI